MFVFRLSIDTALSCSIFTGTIVLMLAISYDLKSAMIGPQISSISVSLCSRSPLYSLHCLSVLLCCSSDLTDWVALIGFGLALMAFLLFSYGVLVLSCLLLLMPCDMVFSVPASAIYHLKFALLYCSYYDSHSALFV